MTHEQLIIKENDKRLARIIEENMPRYLDIVNEVHLLKEILE